MEYTQHDQNASQTLSFKNYRIPRAAKSDEQTDLSSVSTSASLDYQIYYASQSTSMRSALQGLWGNPIEPPPPPPLDMYGWDNNNTPQGAGTTAVVQHCPVLVSNPLKRKHEAPKIGAKTTGPGLASRRSAFGDSIDQSLPKDLTTMFQPLYCKLCDTRCSSSINAKLHYNGKNHDKRVRNWLIDLSKRTGEPVHKRAASKDLQLENDPRYSYCQVCDLRFTSKPHAESHYMGRAHQKAMAGHTPAGSGFYDQNGQWKRMVTPSTETAARDGIGLAFAKPEEFRPAQKTQYFCEICAVNCTNADQLRMHYEGQKHVKRVRQVNSQAQQAMAKAAAAAAAAATTMNMIPMHQHQEVLPQPGTAVPLPHAVPHIPDNILNSVVSVDESVYRRDFPDLSVYRTPSGDFYCQLCNNTMNAEVQFRQHLFSKKHLRKESAVRTDGGVAT